MLRLVLLACLAGAALAAEPASAAHTRAVIATSMGDITVELFDDEAPQTVANFLGLAEGSKAFKDASGAEVRRPFYDGLVFHRVIKGFMIQGGCPQGTGSGSPGFTFPDEINAVSLGLDREMALQGDRLHQQCAYQQREFTRAVLEPRLAARGITRSSSQQERQAALPAVLKDAAGVSLMDFYQLLGYRYDAKLPPSHRPVMGCLAMANTGPNSNGSQFFLNLAETPHLTGKHTVFGQVVAGMAVLEAIGAVATGPGDRPTVPVVIRSIRREGFAAPAATAAATATGGAGR
jgi:cyclophilin family peptidyl-prolyl cis-trans isomerase